MGNSGTKNQNCQFILKFDTNTILQNSVVMFNFLCVQPALPFLGKFGPKIKIVCLH